MIKAAIIPGIQPHNVNKNTIKIEPQPWSKTARGGKMTDKIAFISDMII